MRNITEEEKSAATTLSDMEIFVFPDLMFALVLANMLSPRLWRWRELEHFAGIREMRPKKRLQKLRQFIMDNYRFNLDLETWGLTTRERELERFSAFIPPDEISSSNALFGYHGDKYYYDIDIRRHFGLDKYSSNVIPYWKTETIEAMDAFRHRDGASCGAGECVSLAGLYAAAAFVVCGIPLESIYMMATPLHSQNFIDVDTGILTNNRRILTKAMWSNGSVISKQARRALEHERVTIVSHATGYIHLLYPEATISPECYSHFSAKLGEYLVPDAEAEDRRTVEPRLPDPAKAVFTRSSAPVDLTPEMDYAEISDRIAALSSSNPSAALAPYAAHDLSACDPAPFAKAAVERCPVSKCATLEEISALPGESIYDGPGRCASPDETWNFKRGDGLEKCLLAANALSTSGGEIKVEDATATLYGADGKAVCSFPSSKRPSGSLKIPAAVQG